MYISLAVSIALLFIVFLIYIREISIDSRNSHTFKEISDELDKCKEIPNFNKVVKKAQSLLQKHYNSNKKWNFTVCVPNILLNKWYNKNKCIQLRITLYNIYLSLPGENNAELLINFQEASEILSDHKEAKCIYYGHFPIFKN